MIRIHYNSFYSSFAYFENIFISSLLYAGIGVMIRKNVLHSGDNYIFCIENESVQTTACSFFCFSSPYLSALCLRPSTQTQWNFSFIFCASFILLIL